MIHETIEVSATLEGGEGMDLTVQGKHIEKAAKDIMKCLDGFSYREAMAVLERVSYKLKDNAIINLPSQED